MSCCFAVSWRCRGPRGAVAARRGGGETLAQLTTAPTPRPRAHLTIESLPHRVRSNHALGDGRLLRYACCLGRAPRRLARLGDNGQVMQHQLGGLGLARTGFATNHDCLVDVLVHELLQGILGLGKRVRWQRSVALVAVPDVPRSRARRIRIQAPNAVGARTRAHRLIISSPYSGSHLNGFIAMRIGPQFE